MRGDAAEHLGRVLRAEPGQLYELSDGAAVWLARVESVGMLKRGENRVEFSLVEPVAVRESKLRVDLLIALVKFDRFEWCLEKATELGVHEHFAGGGGAEREGFGCGGGEAAGALGENIGGVGAAVAAGAGAGACADCRGGEGVCGGGDIGGVPDFVVGARGCGGFA